MITLKKTRPQNNKRYTDSGEAFGTSGGASFSGSAYAQVWKRARVLALTPDQVESPLAARP